MVRLDMHYSLQRADAVVVRNYRHVAKEENILPAMLMFKISALLPCNIVDTYCKAKYVLEVPRKQLLLRLR